MVPVEFRKVVLLHALVLRSNLLNRRRLYLGRTQICGSRRLGIPDMP
jgi:hypothetical protein